jgi:UDP-N-acetyl-D-galactosamine dehydrogenase
MSKNTNSIGVIGLGYVGLPLAVEFGKSRSVVGFDLNVKRIQELQGGFDRTKEITQADLKASTKINFTANANELRGCGVFIITVPTPTDEANRPDLSALISASEIVGSVLQSGSIVIYESTVYPGCTEEVCVPALERTSGLVYNRDFFCGYSPERINPGDKMRSLSKITKITSGSTPEVSELVDELYKSIIEVGTWRAPNIKVAEAAKVIENSQRDINIAFVNELSIIFERMEIDTNQVLEAAGTKWNFLPFKPGLVGGHCIGVDPYYLTHKAEMLGYNPEVILAGRRINDGMGKYVAQKALKLMTKNAINISQSVVAIFGLTFKENCPDIRNSKVFDIIHELNSWGVQTLVTDPWADQEEVGEKYKIELNKTHKSNMFDAIIVAVAHDEFKSISADDFSKICKGDRPVIIDVKSLYDKNALLSKGFTVFRL